MTEITETEIKAMTKEQNYIRGYKDGNKDGKSEVLDKIRAEFISLYPRNYAGEPELGGSSCQFSLNKVLNVIDKYKAESEG